VSPLPSPELWVTTAPPVTLPRVDSWLPRIDSWLPPLPPTTPPPLSLDAANDNVAVYAGVVAHTERLTLSTLWSSLVEPRARGLPDLRAGHNLLCLAADAGILGCDTPTEQWQLGLYLPTADRLHPADAPLACRIVGDAVRRGWLAAWQAQLVCGRPADAPPSPTDGDVRSLVERAHRLTGGGEELDAAAAAAAAELSTLQRALGAGRDGGRRPLVDGATWRLGVALVPLVAAALPAAGAPAADAAGAADAGDRGDAMGAAAAAAAAGAALDFSVNHANLVAAAAVLGAPAAARRPPLVAALCRQWYALDAFAAALSSVAAATAAAAAGVSPGELQLSAATSSSG